MCGYTNAGRLLKNIYMAKVIIKIILSGFFYSKYSCFVHLISLIHLLMKHWIITYDWYKRYFWNIFYICSDTPTVAFWSEEEVSWRRGPPWPIFAHPGSAPGRIWPKNNKTCKGPWVLHAYQVSSKSIKRFWRRSWKCESLRTTTTTTDRALWQ